MSFSTSFSTGSDAPSLACIWRELAQRLVQSDIALDPEQARHWARRELKDLLPSPHPSKRRALQDLIDEAYQPVDLENSSSMDRALQEAEMHLIGDRSSVAYERYDAHHMQEALILFLQERLAKRVGDQASGDLHCLVSIQPNRIKIRNAVADPSGVPLWR